jgi:hypothetical protein
MKGKILTKLFLILLFLLFKNLAFAGNIEYPNSYAWNDILGWIDLCKGSGSNCSQDTTSVNVGINALSGFASSSVGLISFNCSDIGACGSSDYKVLKIPSTTSSTLSGYAWNDNIGWISFNCKDLGESVCNTSPYKVWIDENGIFHGYAWNDNIGWISFNSQELSGGSNFYVKTSFVAYASEGELVSSIFDTGIDVGVSYNSIIWEGKLNGGKIKFQLATATSTSSSWEFLGPGCDPNAFYEPSSDSDTTIPIRCPLHYGKRYFRYKVILNPSPDQSQTPVIYKIIINYSP